VRVRVLIGAAALIALLISGSLALGARHEQGGPSGRPGGPSARPGALPAGSAQERDALLRSALSLVSLPHGKLGYRVVAAPPRPRVRAQIDRRSRTITVFVSTSDSLHRIAHDVAHELGHAYDDRRMTPALRRGYLQRRGVPGTAWWPRGRFSDLRSGAGDFAEVFALCHAPSPEFRSRLAPKPTDPCGIVRPQR
jgi:hypothetical protein